MNPEFEPEYRCSKQEARENHRKYFEKKYGIVFGCRKPTSAKRKNGDQLRGWCFVCDIDEKKKERV